MTHKRDYFIIKLKEKPKGLEKKGGWGRRAEILSNSDTVYVACPEHSLPLLHQPSFVLEVSLVLKCPRNAMELGQYFCICVIPNFGIKETQIPPVCARAGGGSALLGSWAVSEVTTGEGQLHPGGPPACSDANCDTTQEKGHSWWPRPAADIPHSC